MHIVLVHVHVLADRIDEFITATLDNARHSRKEAGIARFDVLQQAADPTRFTLVEVYRTAEDPARHKQTAHYNRWRETVAEMMAEPRTGIQYANLFPPDQDW